MEKTANESAAMFYGEDAAAADRSLFVENVGRLAAQTRAGVYKIEREATKDGEEYAKITYRNGGERWINIHADSYTAIVRDIFKQID